MRKKYSDLELFVMENELEFYKDFVRWLREEAFGPEDYNKLLTAYGKDRGMLS